MHAENEDELPENPNYPWGEDSPVHRHQPVKSTRGDRVGKDSSVHQQHHVKSTRGDSVEPRANVKGGQKRSRWNRAVAELKLLWRDKRSDKDEK